DQVPGLDRLGGQDPEGQDVDADVHQQGDDPGKDPQVPGLASERGEPSQDGGDDDVEKQHGDELGAAAQPGHKPGPDDPRDVPDRAQGLLPRLGDPLRAPVQPEHPDGQAVHPTNLQDRNAVRPATPLADARQLGQV